MRGRVTSGGAGVAGVVCTDGRTVTRTDLDGSFDLDPTGPFVFICTPTGYRADNWYLPSDEEPVFELVAEEQATNFSFAHITDLHLAFDRWVFGEPSAATPELITAALDDIVAWNPDLAFIVCTGDQTNNGTEDEFLAYRDIAERSPLRIVAIPGNHDHNSVDPADPHPMPYDVHLGPRWFSFDHGGVHFVAIDWTTYHLGDERDVQDAWVRADLSCVDDGTPVILLTHDLMQADFFERTGAKPVASFSGHWHTSRVVRANGALHVNTAPLTFGGLDYSPAHHRIVRWDGNAISVETHTTIDPEAASPIESAPSLWTTTLAGRALRNAPVIADGLVLATSGKDDDPSGAIEAFDADSGECRWSVQLGSAVKSSPCVVGERVVASAVTGETVCVDLATGSEHWRTEIADDPFQLWTYLRPATDGRLAFVGDTSRFVALDVSDGSIVWSRDDLGSRGNITCHAHPIVVDGTLLVSFAAQIPDMWALDAASGEIRWPTGVVGANIYDHGPEAMMQHLPRTLMSAFGRDPEDPDVYVIRLANIVDRISVADGSIIWSSTIAGWANPSAPVVDGDDIFVCEGPGSVWCLTRDDGSVRWTTRVTEASPLRMGPYRHTGGALFGEATITGEGLIVACGDGRVVMLDRADGTVVHEWAFGTPFAASVAVRGDVAYVVSVDGTLRSFSLRDR